MTKRRKPLPEQAAEQLEAVRRHVHNANEEARLRGDAAPTDTLHLLLAAMLVELQALREDVTTLQAYLEENR